MNIKSLINWKLFRLLLGAGIFAFFAVIPFLLTIQAEALKELPLSLPVILLLSGLQTAVILAVVIFFGLLLSNKIGFGTPLLQDLIAKRSIKERLKPISMMAIKLGALAGVLIIAIDYLLSFSIQNFDSLDIALWKGFLGSFYGGIFEELLMRLFFMTLLVWIFSKIWHTDENKPTVISIWLAIFIAAIVFGLGHLPATAALTALTPLIIFRAILLNGIGGVVFGWLYWKKGLLAAMIAHFSADIVILVIFPIFS